MDPAILPYLGFIVAALILMWGVMELSKRYSRRQKTGAEVLENLVQLDITRRNDPEESLSVEDTADEEDEPASSVQTRAQQNGHYSESKKPF